MRFRMLKLIILHSVLATGAATLVAVLVYNAVMKVSGLK